MLIDAGLITYLEDLSRLRLSEADKERLSGDLNAILAYMSKLEELDTSQTPERSHPFDHVNAFREDAVRDSFPRVLILQNAPETDGAAFVVPQTVE